MSDDGLFALDDLPEDDRIANREAAEVMVKGARYRFPNGAKTIPLERRAKGVPHAGEPIEFEYATYLGWREEQEEHMFNAEVGDKCFFAPMYLDLGDNPTCIPCGGATLTLV